MSELTLSAQLRPISSRGSVRRLRRQENRVPAVIYGGDDQPVSISLPADSLNRQVQQESFYTHILKIDLDGKQHDVVVKDVQRHPYKRQVVHLDFLRVLADRELTMQVPIHVINESTAAGVRAGGIVNHLLNELEIRCLPRNIPEAIEVDIAELEQEQTLHLSELKLPEGVELVHPVDADHDPGVVAIHKPRAEAAVEETPAETPDAAADTESQEGPAASGE